ncbi:MAG TPA: ATP-binding protein [Gemmatimonadaceae bacterium]|nr:ATP-binding protein [Gemmatimonadaceae bacterium]
MSPSPSWRDDALVAELPLVLMRIDREGRLVYLSPSWERQSGFTIAESLGRPYLSFVDAGDHAACRATERYLYAGHPGPGEGKLRMYRSDGTLRVAEVRFFAMYDAAGVAAGLGGVLIDVTGRRHDPRRQGDALQLSAERTRLLIEHATFGVFGCTPDGRLLDANPSMAQMLGYRDATALLAASAFDTLCPVGEVRDRCLGSLRDGARAVTYDQPCRRADGQSVRLRLTMSAERDPGGRIRFLQGLAEDVTERERREEIVRRGERMASLGRTLAGVAHEINNPLAAITGFAQILLKKEQTPDDRHALETVLGEARRAARIVKDLLTIARREEGVSPVRADLHAIVRYILDTQHYAMETRGIRLDVRLASGTPHVLADPAQLEQVVLNLVVNARQALEARLERRDGADDWRPRLEVATHVVDGTVTLAVADNGPGIPATDLPHIWDPFWSTRQEGEGTGLGLSVVHSIVVAHGGSIEVTSVPSERTRFVITLPLAAEVRAPDMRPRGARPDRRVASRPLDILVVDDEPVIRELLARYFSTRGHAVVAAGDGAQALRLAEQSAFDVVISDLRMPGMDGLELIQRLRPLPTCASTRFLISTGDATAPALHRDDDAMAGVVVVSKPYDVDALVDLVEGR